jgi:TPR repeat protein
LPQTSPADALALLRRAAEAGHSPAQIELGKRLAEAGQDTIEAYMWLDVAVALAGDDAFSAAATEARDALAKTMDLKDVMKAQTRSRELVKRLER